MRPTDCSIVPHEGVFVAGYGEVAFGMTMDEIRAVLGRGQGHRRFRSKRAYPFELDYMATPPLWARFAFDDYGRCHSVEFNWPREVPPLLEGRRLNGPRLRESVEVVAALGYQPWTNYGPLDDADAVGTPDSVVDSVKFHEIGLSLWTSTETVTPEHGDLGEHALDTVFLWRRGYWENAREQFGIRMALPATLAGVVPTKARTGRDVPQCDRSGASQPTQACSVDPRPRHRRLATGWS